MLNILNDIESGKSEKDDTRYQQFTLSYLHIENSAISSQQLFSKGWHTFEQQIPGDCKKKLATIQLNLEYSQ
jgi:hypothetical protein